MQPFDPILMSSSWFTESETTWTNFFSFVKSFEFNSQWTQNQTIGKKPFNAMSVFCSGKYLCRVSQPKIFERSHFPHTTLNPNQPKPDILLIPWNLSTYVPPLNNSPPTSIIKPPTSSHQTNTPPLLKLEYLRPSKNANNAPEVLNSLYGCVRTKIRRGSISSDLHHKACLS